MPDRVRLRTEWLIAFGLWTLAGCAMSAQLYYVQALMHKPVTWTQAFRHDLLYAWLWAAMTPAILGVIRWASGKQLRWFWAAPLHFGAGLGFAFLHRVAMTVLAPKPAGSGWFSSFWGSYLFYADYGVIFYGIYLTLDTAIDYYRRSEANRLKASQLETQLAQAQLQALRMQLHPHFLFNTLHTISSLVREEPDSAELMIARLGDLLRASLANAQVQVVTLRQEMDLLSKYLEIERIRFEDRLRLDIRLDPSTLDAPVPNLILQPLVENAIRHGIAKRPEGGTVGIVSKLTGGRLMLKVTDNGVGLPAGGLKRNGVGLENTRSRLERIYGESQNFSVVSTSDGGVEAIIEIPFEMSAKVSEERDAKPTGADR